MEIISHIKSQFYQLRAPHTWPLASKSQQWPPQNQAVINPSLPPPLTTIALPKSSSIAKKPPHSKKGLQHQTLVLRLMEGYKLG